MFLSILFPKCNTSKVDRQDRKRFSTGTLVYLYRPIEIKESQYDFTSKSIFNLNHIIIRESFENSIKQLNCISKTYKHSTLSLSGVGTVATLRSNISTKQKLMWSISICNWKYFNDLDYHTICIETGDGKWFMIEFISNNETVLLLLDATNNMNDWKLIVVESKQILGTVKFDFIKLKEVAKVTIDSINTILDLPEGLIVFMLGHIISQRSSIINYFNPSPLRLKF
ncbi:hypothetical protein K502DRAFT_351878 [Neoconidiobolus thromboides FSU 785]|nr:hypothetical protein K502DRAFT_351878 [Neoconidiobolus thromboides FSU 785]